MAIRYLDGFDDYQTADLTKNWTTVIGSATYVLIQGSGRTGSRLALLNATGLISVAMTLDAQATWIIGFAFRVSINVAPSSAVAFLEILDAGSAQVDLRFMPDNTLRITRAGTTLATSTEAILEDTWYYVELKVTIGNAGSYQLRVNGQDWIASAVGDTQATANATGNMIRLNSLYPKIVDLYFDDLYLLDGTGATDNDFWGDVTVLSKFPNGNGATNNFTGQDADSTDNYLNADEKATDFPDEDTTYNESGTVGHIDLYDMEDLTGYTEADYDVMGVMATVCAKKSDTGVKTMCVEVRHDSTNYDGDTFAPSATSYANFNQCYGDAPDTTAWTVAAVNALQVGAKIVS